MYIKSCIYHFNNENKYIKGAKNDGKKKQNIQQKNQPKNSKKTLLSCYGKFRS